MKLYKLLLFIMIIALTIFAWKEYFSPRGAFRQAIRSDSENYSTYLYYIECRNSVPGLENQEAIEELLSIIEKETNTNYILKSLKALSKFKTLPPNVSVILEKFKNDKNSEVKALAELVIKKPAL